MILAILALFLNTTPANAIIGGARVSIDEEIAKSTVLLYGENSNGGFTCTGTILNSQYILSAAHCVTDVKGMVVLFTTDGSTSEKISNLMKSGTNARRVVGVNFNVDYPNTGLGSMFPHNDISLIRFAGGIPAGFKPVTLLNPTVMNKYLKLGMNIIIAGFGQREDNASGTLYKNNVVLQKFYDKTVVVGEAGSSSCHGDSGGPAFINVGGKLYQFAVLSRGEPGCVSSAIYTPLTSNFFGKMATPDL